MARPTSIPAPARLLVLALATAALIVFAPIHDGTPKADAQALTYRHVDLTLTDTLGGAVTGVAVDAGTGVAYVSRGARVEALDVSSDPTGPTLLATSERLAGVARVLGAAGERVFVAVRNTAQDGTTIETLMVLSTADLAAKALPAAGGIAVSDKEPPSSGRIARVERAFTADASTAYLVATAEPRVVKVIDLRAWPSTSAAEVELAADINGIAIAGATLVAATDGGVTTIDVRDPARPDVIGALPLIGGAGAVAITGTTAYATTWDGLAAVDVGDSAHPAVRGPRNPYCGTERYRALAVTGGRAWTGPVDQPFPSTFHSCGLAQTDAVGSSYLAFAFRMRGIASAGDAALFAGQHVGLTSIRWPAPPDSSPPTGWSMPALGDVTGLHGASSVVRASDADSELWTFDTAVASAPVPVDRSVLWPMPEQADRLADRTGGLAVDGDVAFQVFLGGYRYGGSVAAIALAPLAQPTVIGQWRSSDVPGDRRWGSPDDDHPTSPYGPYLSGDTLYVTGPSVALTALDVASPAAVRWLGRFGEPESGFSGGGLAPDGPRAWLALYKRGLGLLDVSDPTAPRLIDRFALPDSTRDVALVGGDVLASTVDRVEPVPGDDFPPPPSPGHGLLVVLDAATHRPVARLPTDVPGDRLVVDGGRALLYGEGRIEVVDIRDPRRPVTVGAVRTGAADSPDVRPLAVVGDTIWAGTGELGISIYRLTEGETFTPSPPITPRAYLPYGLAARP